MQSLDVTFRGELHSALQEDEHLIEKFRGGREIFPRLGTKEAD